MKVDSKTGEAGKAAGKALEAKLNKLDKKINSLDPKSKVPVLDKSGKQVSSLLAKTLQKQWNNQKFSITSKDYRPINGGLGGTSPGKTELMPEAVSGYQAGAVAFGYDSDAGLSTLVFHELGHLSQYAREVSSSVGPVTSQINVEREAAASRSGNAEAAAVQETYICQLTSC